MYKGKSKKQLEEEALALRKEVEEQSEMWRRFCRPHPPMSHFEALTILTVFACLYSGIVYLIFS